VFALHRRISGGDATAHGALDTYDHVLLDETRSSRRASLETTRSILARRRRRRPASSMRASTSICTQCMLVVTACGHGGSIILDGARTCLLGRRSNART
jgi:hypothetical protein